MAEYGMPFDLIQISEGKFKSLVDELGDEMRSSFLEIAKKRRDGNNIVPS